MKAPPTTSFLWWASTVALLSLQQCHVRVGAATYNVSPYEEDSSSADDDSVISTVTDAFAVAQPGDTIVLGDGTYTDKLDRIASVFAGEEGNPITVTGSRDAIIKAPSPSVRIDHSWITIEGFTVDGEHGEDSGDADSYVNKCVEVVGQGYSDDEALEGFVMRDMHVTSCGGECVRLKNFVINADITGNTIEKCGLYDFEFMEGNKNGEGVYIGTSTGQWDDGEDRCNNNWVRGNIIETCGNECIEIKEGSSGNLIEDNVCSNQFDSKSGCYGARGDDNTFRYNSASNCDGAGIRLGGNEVDDYTYGQNNNIYGNDFTDADAAALSIRSLPQGIICGNSCSGDNCILTWNEDLGDIEETWDATCPEIDDDFDFPTDDADSDDDLTPTVAPTMAPTVAPTMEPTGQPTMAPTVEPTVAPTVDPREEGSDDDSIEVDRPVEDDDEDDDVDDQDDDSASEDDDDSNDDDESNDEDDSVGDDYQSNDSGSDDDDETNSSDDYQSDDDDSDDDDDSNGDDYQSDDSDDYESDDDSDDDDDSTGDDYESDDDGDDDDVSTGDDYESDDDGDDDDLSTGDDYESDDDGDDDDVSTGDDYESDDDGDDDDGDDDSMEGRDDDGDDYK